MPHPTKDTGVVDIPGAIEKGMVWCYMYVKVLCSCLLCLPSFYFVWGKLSFLLHLIQQEWFVRFLQSRIGNLLVRQCYAWIRHGFYVSRNQRLKDHEAMSECKQDMLTFIISSKVSDAWKYLYFFKMYHSNIFYWSFVETQEHIVLCLCISLYLGLFS